MSPNASDLTWWTTTPTNNVQLEKNRGTALVYHLSFITTDLLHVKGLTRWPSINLPRGRFIEGRFLLISPFFDIQNAAWCCNTNLNTSEITRMKTYVYIIIYNIYNVSALQVIICRYGVLSWTIATYFRNLKYAIILKWLLFIARTSANLSKTTLFEDELCIILHIDPHILVLNNLQYYHTNSRLPLFYFKVAMDNDHLVLPHFQTHPNIRLLINPPINSHEMRWISHSKINFIFTWLLTYMYI
jgi:hypothetical protein